MSLFITAIFNNWAIPQAANEWVLIVDADERITPSLAAEIQRLLLSEMMLDGYWIRRANFFLGRRVRFSGWQSDRVLRLFRRDLGRYVGDTDHAQIDIKSRRVGSMVNRLEHFTYRTYDDYFRKFSRYTNQCAERKYRMGARPSAIRLLLTAPLSFLRDYVLRLGFLDGFVGLQVCWLAAFASFMKQAKLWHLHQSAKASESTSDARPSFVVTRRASGVEEIACQ